MTPQLFDQRGKFTPLDADALANLSPERQSLYQDVADTAANLERAEADLKDATDHVAECVRAVADAEKATAASRPTFHDLWKATYGRPRQQRAQPTGGTAG